MELQTGITKLKSLFLTPGELAKPLFAQGVQEWLSNNTQATEEAALEALAHVAMMTTEGKAVAYETLLSVLKELYSDAVPEVYLEWSVFSGDQDAEDLRDNMSTLLQRDHDNYGDYNHVFASLLSAGVPQDITQKTIKTFTKGNKRLSKECLDSANAFYNFVAKYKINCHLTQIAEGCFGDYGGGAIEQMVTSDTYQTTYFDDIHDLAKSLELSSLEFFTGDSPDMFYCEYNYRSEEEDFIDDMTSFLKTANTTASNFAKNLLSRAVEEFGESTVSQIIEDKALTFTATKDQTVLSSCYSILADSDLFDAESDIGIAQEYGREAGAQAEMVQSLNKLEIFPFSASFSYTDKDKYCISFDMAEIIPHIFNECEAHEYLSLDNGCMDDVLYDAIFSHEYIKLNDLDVPYYGFSGYDSTVTQEHITALFETHGINI